MAKQINVQQRVRLVDDTGTTKIYYDTGTVAYTDVQIDNTLDTVSVTDVNTAVDRDVDGGNVNVGDLLFIKNTGAGAAKIGLNVGTSYYPILLESGESIVWRVHDGPASLVARATSALQTTTLSVTIFNTAS
jgi:hypothetical protein